MKSINSFLKMIVISTGCIACLNADAADVPLQFQRDPGAVMADPFVLDTESSSSTSTTTPFIALLSAKEKAEAITLAWVGAKKDILGADIGGRLESTETVDGKQVKIQKIQYIENYKSPISLDQFVPGEKVIVYPCGHIIKVSDVEDAVGAYHGQSGSNVPNDVFLPEALFDKKEQLVQTYQTLVDGQPVVTSNTKDHYPFRTCSLCRFELAKESCGTVMIVPLNPAANGKVPFEQLQSLVNTRGVHYFEFLNDGKELVFNELNTPSVEYLLTVLHETVPEKLAGVGALRFNGCKGCNMSSPQQVLSAMKLTSLIDQLFTLIDPDGTKYYQDYRRELKQRIVIGITSGVLNLKIMNITTDLLNGILNALITANVHIKIQSLDLGDNNLTVLSPTIGQLKQLKTLNLDGNYLETLPIEIGGLPQLQTLSIMHNKLKVLPDEIGNLSQLQILDLCDNQLQVLPNTIGKLKQLQTLILSVNKLKKLPETMSSLSSCLKDLGLIGNDITDENAIKTMLPFSKIF
jgi:hypothetical protein